MSQNSSSENLIRTFDTYETTFVEHTEQQIKEDPSFLSGTITKFISLYLSISLFVLPILFGGVHRRTYGLLELSSWILFCVMLFKHSDKIKNLFNDSKNKATKLVVYSCACFFTYIALQQAILSTTSTTHPVILSASINYNINHFLDTLSWVAFCASTFLLVRLYVRNSPENFKRLIKLSMTACCLVSAIGLAHWFYDNGKLFWTFAPDWIFQSTRARWPFVNSDHFAHYILICTFLFISTARIRLSELLRFGYSSIHHDRESLSSLFLDTHFQRRIIAATWSTLGILVCALGLSASLSRGAWLAAGLSLTTFIILDWLVVPAVSYSGRTSPKSRLQPLSSQRPPQLNKPNSLAGYIFDPKIWNHKGTRFLFLLFSFAIFAFFLNERGTQLIAGRLEYGLTYTKDDVRWQMYQDSYKIFSTHPLIGVGSENWASEYSQVIRPELSGINPVYLHSDPYQFLIEYGLIGTLPFTLSIFGIIALTFSTCRRYPNKSSLLVLGLALGLVSLLIASFFDFPLRIPAITFQSIVLLALLCASIDEPVLTDTLLYGLPYRKDN